MKCDVLNEFIFVIRAPPKSIRCNPSETIAAITSFCVESPFLSLKRFIVIHSITNSSFVVIMVAVNKLLSVIWYKAFPVSLLLYISWLWSEEGVLNFHKKTSPEKVAGSNRQPKPPPATPSGLAIRLYYPGFDVWVFKGLKIRNQIE